MQTVQRKIGIGALFMVIVGAATFMLFQARAQGQAAAQDSGPKQTNVTVLDNAHVAVRRDTFPVGMHQAMHAAGAVGDNRYVLMIQLTPGQIEAVIDGKKSSSDKVGTIWELPGAPSQHGFTNVGQTSVDVMVIQLK